MCFHHIFNSTNGFLENVVLYSNCAHSGIGMCALANNSQIKGAQIAYMMRLLRQLQAVFTYSRTTHHYIKL